MLIVVYTPIANAIVSAYDVDADDSHVYAIEDGNTFHKAFQIDKNTGQILHAKQLLDYESISVHRLLIKFTDNGGKTGTSFATITVLDQNEPPILLPADCAVLENSPRGTPICTISSVDVDNGLSGIPVYSLFDEGGATSSGFQIDRETGELSVNVASLFDYETSSQLSVQVCVTDKGPSAQQNCDHIEVTIVDVNEPPMVESGQVCIVNETPYDATEGQLLSLENTIVCKVRLSDPDTNSQTIEWKTHQYSAVSDAENNEMPFYIGGNGNIRIRNPQDLDFENVNEYTMNVIASDGGNLISDAVEVIIRITDLNERPALSFTNPMYVNENEAVGVPVGKVESKDFDRMRNGALETFSLSLVIEGNKFSIGNDGIIRVAVSPLNFEEIAQYSGTIQAMDSRNLFSLPQVITIQLNNKNEAPILVDGLREIKENEAPSTYILPAIVATDPDAGQSLRYSIVSVEPVALSDPEMFAIDPSNGFLYINRVSPNYEDVAEYTITVRVEDDGRLLAQSEMGVRNAEKLATTAAFTIKVLNVNERPLIDSQSLILSENIPVGTEFGTPFSNSLTDPEMNVQTHVYKIVSGNHKNVFGIDLNSGQLKVKKNLDFESRNVYQLKIQVTDDDEMNPLSWTTDALISLKDINEPPMMDAFERYVNENVQANTLLSSPLQAIDNDIDDQARIRYSITGGTGLYLFSIDSVSGQLSVSPGANIDYENMAEYTLILNVNDMVNDVTVNGHIYVRDVNERPAWLQLQDPALGSLTENNGLTVTVRENRPTGTEIAVLKALDVDVNTILTFSICDQSIPGAFYVTKGGGQRARVGILDSDTFNYEKNKKMHIKICVDDEEGLSDSMTLHVDIEDVEEPPHFVESHLVVNVVENTAASTVLVETLIPYVFDEDVTDTQNDVMDMVVFRIAESTCGIDWFLLDETTGKVTIGQNAKLDFETTSFCSLQIKVRDLTDKESESPLTLSIHINDINEYPVFTSSNYKMSIHESAPLGYILGFVDANDQDKSEDLHFRFAQGVSTTIPFVLTPVGSLKLDESATALNYEDGPRAYTLAIEVVDKGNLVSTSIILIRVLNANDPPKFTSEPFSCTVDENHAVGPFGCSVTASDQDAGETDTLLYSIVSGNVNSVFSIVSNGGTGQIVITNSAELDFEEITSYDLTIQVKDDGEGSLMSTAIVSIVVNDVNERPGITYASLRIAEAASVGTSLVSFLNPLVDYVAAGWDVDDGDVLTYSLLEDGEGTFQIDMNTGSITLAAKINYEQQSSYEIVVQVQDVGLLTSSTAMSVIVLDENDAPTVSDRTYSMTENPKEGARVAALDVQDEDLKQAHTFTIESQRILTSAGIVQDISNTVLFKPTAFSSGKIDIVHDANIIKSYFNFESVQEIYVEIKAHDNGAPSLSSGTAIITMVIRDVNERCLFDASSPTSITVDENTVGQVHQVVASDPDSIASGMGSLKYRIIDGNDNGAFSIETATGKMFANNGKLNFEVDPSYTLLLSATDNDGLQCTLGLEVVLNDVHEKPVLIGNEFSIWETVSDGFSIESLESWDPENDTLSFTLDEPNGFFTIGNSDGVIRVKDGIDYEQNKFHDIIVRVEDASTLTTSASVRISILNVNEPPKFGHQNDLTVPENAMPGDLIGFIDAATDPDENSVLVYEIIENVGEFGMSSPYFLINSCSGSIRVAGNFPPFNYESIKWFKLVVQVTDDGGNVAISDSFFINVLDVNEPPSCKSFSLSFGEHTSLGSISTLEWKDTDAHVRDSIAAFEIESAFDPDSLNLFEVVSPSAGDFVLHLVQALNHEKMGVHTLTLRISDSGELASKESSVSLSSLCTVEIEVVDQNDAPTIESRMERSIPENSIMDSKVGLPIQGVDTDDGDILSYSISTTGDVEGDDTFFSIHKNSGQLSVIREINYETQSEYTLQVGVIDQTTSAVFTTVTVLIEDVNEQPQFERNCTISDLDGALGGPYSAICIKVAEDTMHGALIWTLEADDEDVGQQLLFAVQSATSLVWISSIDTDSAAMFLKGNALDFEDNTVHELTITVSDTGTGFLSDAVPLFIRVENVNEAPYKAPSSPTQFSLAENADTSSLGTLLAEDPENDAITFLLLDTHPIGNAFTVSTAGVVAPTRAFDYEELQTIEATFEDPILSINVAVSDGVLTSQFIVIVTLTDSEEDPNMALDRYVVAVSENAVAHAYIGKVEGRDPDKGDVLTYSVVDGELDDVSSIVVLNSGTGLMTLKEEDLLKVEIKADYSFNVMVTDNTGRNDKTTVVLKVSNSNFSPTCTAISCWITENTKALFRSVGEAVGTCTLPVQDKDDGQSHNFVIGGDDASQPFEVDFNTGTVQVKSGDWTLDFETFSQYSLEVQVTDIPEQGSPLSVVCGITIDVLNSNEVPILLTTVLHVGENQRANFLVGTLLGHDEDVGDTLTFSFEDEDTSHPFRMEEETGKIFIQDPNMLNYEVQSMWTLSVRTTDSMDAHTVSFLDIHILDENDMPMVPETTFVVDEITAQQLVGYNGNPSVWIGQLVGSDEDFADELSYTIFEDGLTNGVGVTVGSPSFSGFTLEASTGNLYASNDLLDFEKTRRFSLKVQVDDSKLQSFSTIHVHLRNRNEAPTFVDSIYAFTIPENSDVGTIVGKVVAQDPEFNDHKYVAALNINIYEPTPIEVGAFLYKYLGYQWIEVPDYLKHGTFLYGLESQSMTTDEQVIEIQIASSGTLYVLYENAVAESDLPPWILSSFTRSAHEALIFSNTVDTLVFNIFERVVTSGEMLWLGGNRNIGDDTQDDVHMYVVAGTPNALEYRLSNDATGMFAINALGEVTIAKNDRLDFEAFLNPLKNFIPFEMKAMVLDSWGFSSQTSITVELTDVNEAPTILNKEALSYTIGENTAESFFVGKIFATDADLEDIVEFSTNVDASHPFLINSDGEVWLKSTSFLNFETTDVYQLPITATDLMNYEDTAIVTIRVLDENEAPVFDLSSYTFFLDENTPFFSPVGQSVQASDVDIGQNDYLRYSIIQGIDDSDKFQMDSCSGQLFIGAHLMDYEFKDQYHLDVLVVDNGTPALSSQTSVLIQIVNVNEAPQFATIPSFILKENELVPVNTSIVVGEITAFDYDANTVLLFSTTSLLFSIDEEGVIKTEEMFNFEEMQKYSVDIMVTDGALSSSTTVVVNIKDVNEAPILPDVEFTLGENEAATVQVGTPLSVEDPDSANTAHLFTLSGQSAKFRITKAGQIFALRTFNFEVEEEFELTVLFTDGEFTASCTVTIKIADENEKPLVTAGQTGSLFENAAEGTVVMQVLFTDVDSISTNVFSLQDTSVPFRMDSSGEITSARPFNYEMDHHTYTVAVKVCDHIDGLLCDTKTVSISIADVDETPFMNTMYCKIIENTNELLHATNAGEKCTFMASDEDEDSCFTYSPVNDALPFEITTSSSNRRLDEHFNTPRRLTGSDHCWDVAIELMLKSDGSMDFESQSQFIVPMIAYDKNFDINGLSVDFSIIVDVVNANDAPTMINESFTVEETAVVNTPVGYPLPGQDEDFGDRLSYSLINVDAYNGLFQIHSQTGQISLVFTPEAANFAPLTTFTLQVKVMDLAAATVQASVNIVVTKDNFRPEWDDSFPVTINIDENLPGFSLVGDKSMDTFASDRNPTDVLGFSIQSKSDSKCASHFELTSDTGQLSVLDGAVLDFENQATFVCSITICDPFLLCAVRDVKIVLNNVNEEPTFSNELSAPSSLRRLANIHRRRLEASTDQYSCVMLENNTIGDKVCTCFEATDPDIGDDPNVQFSIACADNDHCASFEVTTVTSSSGNKKCAQLTTKTALNFEGQSSYSITLVASDPGGLTASAPILITVQDINEVHSVTSDASVVTVPENAPIGTTLTVITSEDPDSEVSPHGTIQYYIQSVQPLANALFTVHPETGILSTIGNLDFEATQAFTVVIRAEDLSTKKFVATTNVLVQVSNVADVKILNVIGAEEMNTLGGNTIEIVGTNFGFTQQPANPSWIEIQVTYGTPTSLQWYTATNCHLTTINTRVECTTVGGVGRDFQWKILVRMFVNEAWVEQSAISDHRFGSYESPELVSVSCAAPLPTTGSAQHNIIIEGHFFGQISSTAFPNPIQLNYGTSYTVTNCQVQASETALEKVVCKSAVGVGKDFMFTIVVGGQSSGFIGSATCVYATPEITSVPAIALHTKGGNVLVLEGSSFGVFGSSVPTVTYETAGMVLTAKDCVVSVSDSEIRCLSVPGQGIEYKWKVGIAGQVSSLSLPSQNTSYSAPSIVNVVGFEEAPTIGGTVFYIMGTEFGPDTGIWPTPIVTYTDEKDRIYTAVGCRREYLYAHEHSRIECKTAAGTGHKHIFTVVVGQLEFTSLPQTTSYAAPVILSATVESTGGTEIETQGSQRVILEGTNFGEIAANPLRGATYGPTGVELIAENCELVANNVRIVCNTIPGAGHGLVWIVNINGLRSQNPAMDYQGPIITSIQGPGSFNADTLGGQMVTIIGKNFGPRLNLINALTCGPTGMEYTFTDVQLIDHETITCLTVPGVGALLSVSITVSSVTSPPSLARLSYQKPEIFRVEPSQIPTQGINHVEVFGNSFGVNVIDADTRVQWFPPFNAPPVYVPILSHVVYNSSAEMMVIQLPSGYGGSANLRVQTGTVSIQESNNVEFTYKPPTLLYVFSEAGPPQCAPQCLTLDLVGDSMHTTGRVIITTTRPTTQDLDTLTFTEVIPSNWTHDYIRIPQVDGLVGFVTVLVGSLGQYLWTESLDFSWKDPVVVGWETKNATCTSVDSIETLCPSYLRLTGDPSLYETIPTNAVDVFTEKAATVGGATLQLYAKFIGRNPTVQVGGSLCTNVIVTIPDLQNAQDISDSEAIRLITCIMPPGQGLKQSVIVYRGSVGSTPRRIDFIEPTVEWDPSVLRSPTLGGISFTIQGTNLGSDPRILIGSREALIDTHTHDSIKFAIPSGEGGPLPITLWAGDQSSSNTFAYDPAVIETIQYSAAPTVGGANVLISGMNFGDLELSDVHEVTFGGRYSCIPTTWSQSAITCVADPGQGINLIILINVAGQVNTDVSITFSYDKPTITSIDRNESPTAGYTCSCFENELMPCETNLPPYECKFQEVDVESIGGEILTYCVTYANKVEVEGNYRVVSSQISDGSPVFQLEDNSAWTLMKIEGYWSLILGFEVRYRALGTTENPPLGTWVEPLSNTAVDVSVTAGSCEEPFAVTCPAETTFCEPVLATIEGSNFGQLDEPWSIAFVSTGLSVLPPVEVLGSHIISFNQTVVHFKVPPGYGVNRKLLFTVGGQSQSNVDDIVFGYEPPELVFFETKTVDRSTCGGFEITLMGRNFGSSHAMVLVQGREARVDGLSSHQFACANCKYGTSGPCMDTVYEVCYPSSYVTEPLFEWSNGCTGESVRLCDASESIGIAPPIESFLSHSHNMITTIVPAGIGANIDLQVVVGDVSSNVMLFSYNQPSILKQLPNAPDANGGSVVVITGTDFGCYPSGKIEIVYENIDPELRRLQVDDTSNSPVVWLDNRTLEWNPLRTKAGEIGIILTAGGNPMTNDSQATLQFSCESGSFPGVDDFCDECPSGAYCKGGIIKPVAKEGWWYAPPVFIPCEPRHSCEVGNKCSEGYTGGRCANCASTHHRLNGECITCPTKPWVPVFLTILAALGLLAANTYLTRKGVSLGLLSIGVDYFQILSMFINAKVAWPPSILSAFSAFTIFNLNLEIIAPECWNVEVSYTDKWLAIELLPLFLGTFFSLMFMSKYLQKRFLQKRTTRLTSHLPKLIGSTLLTMYYLYLYITQTTFNVFNCVNSEPDDGNSYMASIDAKCYESGGIHLRLLPWAILACIIYCIGYPAFVGYTLFNNRELVMEDQLLRAMDRGLSRATNPNAWDFRKKFSRLYSQFKPEYWYWILAIIARKFMIAIVSLLFQQNPTFQLAMTLLVVFISYTIQVKNRPYMSKTEANIVVAEYGRKVASEKRMAEHRGEVYNQPGHLRLSKHVYQNIHMVSTSSILTNEKVVNFLWDYNTVESVLLFCASLICICGIMFESGQIESRDGSFDNFSGNLLSVVTLLIIFTSFSYFAIVLLTEIVVALNPKAYSKLNKLTSALSGQKEYDDDGDILEENEMLTHLTTNPLHQRQAEVEAKNLMDKNRQQDTIMSLQSMQLRALRRQKDQSKEKKSTLRRPSASPQNSEILGSNWLQKLPSVSKIGSMMSPRRGMDASLAATSDLSVDSKEQELSSQEKKGEAKETSN